LGILENKWALASLAIVCWAIVATFSTAFFYYQYTDLMERTRGTAIHVNLGLNYGNGTARWYNDTKATMGMTPLDITLLVAKTNYTPSGMGAFVNSIDNVKNSNPSYWMWWTWTSYSGWNEGPVACDKYVVADGETLYWYYENTTISPLPQPP
jgi:hypothetical protein